MMLRIPEGIEVVSVETCRFIGAWSSIHDGNNNRRMQKDFAAMVAALGGHP